MTLDTTNLAVAEFSVLLPQLTTDGAILRFGGSICIGEDLKMPDELRWSEGESGRLIPFSMQKSVFDGSICFAGGAVGS